MRTETITKTYFHYDELPTDEAKERARDWYKSMDVYHDWHDGVYQDFENICDIIGIDLDKGGIQYTGFWSQGDGASFTGTYQYRKGFRAALMSYAPKDKNLHAVADELQHLQRRNFYKLGATIARHQSRYCHENTIYCDAENVNDDREPTEDASEAMTEIMRVLARWLYRALEREYEWLMSDEQVEEAIRANEYEFDEDGELA